MQVQNAGKIDHLAEKVRVSPEHFQHTLEALGQEVGIQSRIALIAAVKRRTGMRPSEFFCKNDWINKAF